jgi:hypothetical protein
VALLNVFKNSISLIQPLVKRNIEHVRKLLCGITWRSNSRYSRGINGGNDRGTDKRFRREYLRIGLAAEPLRLPRGYRSDDLFGAGDKLDDGAARQSAGRFSYLPATVRCMISGQRVVGQLS